MITADSYTYCNITTTRNVRNNIFIGDKLDSNPIEKNEILKKWFEKKEPCMHDSCTECHGTGVKKDGSFCVHFISCPCPKCSPRTL